MNRPIGIIGDINQGKEWLAKHLNDEQELYEIDNTASMDEVKEFRTMLLSHKVKQTVGIVYMLNKFSSSKQAVLLKIFEELPEYNKCYFLASFLPTFTIQTRSEIHHMKNVQEPELMQAMKFIIHQINTQKLTNEEYNAWKVLIKTHSLLKEGIISQKEKETILKGIGL